MKERTLIGFSLSLCICDIVEGKKNIDDVLFVQTGCNPANQVEIDAIKKQYSEVYWRKYPQKALEIFDLLLNDPDYPRVGWANSFQKNCVPIYWGHWLSIGKTDV